MKHGPHELFNGGQRIVKTYDNYSFGREYKYMKKKKKQVLHRNYDQYPVLRL